jgi:hypothetical protein
MSAQQVSTRRGGPARQKAARMAMVPVLALVLAASAARARPLSDQEKASLAATVQGFEAAVRADDHTRVAQIMPPKVVDALARRIGATSDQVIAEMTKATQQMLQEGNTKIESFRMDLGSADHKELAGGAPYVLIPTHTIIAAGGERVEERSHALAILDDGKWFLLRIKDEVQLYILREGYPEFGGVELPSSSIEALNP